MNRYVSPLIRAGFARCFIVVALFAMVLPAASQCAITNLSMVAMTPCDANGEYDVRIEVSYTNAPSNGTLDVEGQSFPFTTSPTVVTLTNLVADGLPTSITALFSASNTCSLTVNSLYTAPTCPNPACAITNVAFLGASTCAADGTYMARISVAYTNEPASGLLDVNGQTFPIGASPQTVVLSGLVGDGLPVNIAALFSADPACSTNISALFTAPLCPTCAITNIAFVSSTVCDPGLQTFSADVVVSFTNAPAGGFLNVNGAPYAISASPQTVTLVNLPADGAPVNVTAFFTQDPACSNMVAALFTAPTCCAITAVAFVSDTGCDPATGLFDVDLSITSTNTPVTGLLVVNGTSFALTPSPQVVTITGLVADGLPVDVDAFFSAFPGCTNQTLALFTAPVCPVLTNACAITSLVYVADTGCDPATGTYDVRIEVAYTNAPTNGMLDVNGQPFAISTSPQVVTLTALPADGLPVDVAAFFTADPACSNTVVALFTAPVCPVPTNACAITSVVYVADTGCDPATGTYDVRIEVAYTNAPTNGMLDVNGQPFAISTSPQVVTLTALPADGLPVDVAAFFTADPACSNTVVALFTAPVCPPPTNACAITSVVYVADTGCDPATGTYDVMIEVAYTNGATNGMLDVNGVMVPISTSPQVVTLTGLVADGLPVDVTALFTADPACSNTVAALFTAPVCPTPTNACSLLSVVYLGDTGCNPANGTYNVDFELSYTNAPTNGMIDVNGQAFPIVASPQTVTLTALPADGLPVDVTAFFTADPACSNSMVAVFTAPVCSTCAITNITLDAIGTCNPDGTVDLDVTVFYDTPPTTGTLDINGIPYAITGSPQSETVPFPGNGGQIFLFAEFSADINCQFGVILNTLAPVCSSQCAIVSVQVANIGTCLPDGTVNVDIEVSFTNAPTPLIVTGNTGFGGVAVTGSPQIVTINENADGSNLTVTVDFGGGICSTTVVDIAVLPVCPVIPPVPPCAITNVVAAGPLACDSNGMTGYDITVFYDNGPTNGMLDVNGVMVPVTTSPQTVSVAYPGDGTTQDVIIVFSADTNCGFTALAALPLPICTTPTNPAPVCAITNVVASGPLACDTNGMSGYDITVFFANGPTNGTLDVNGVIVPVTNSPQTVSVPYPGDGSTQDVVIVFSADTNCAFTALAALPLPVCSATTNPVPTCSIVNVTAAGPLACDSNGMTGYDITVFFTNGPTNGTLDVNGVMVPVTNSPITVSVVYPGDGSTQDVVVAFSADTNCAFTALAALPLPVCTTPTNPAPICAITNVVAVGPLACDTNGMTGYDITVFYTNGPTNGMLDVNGIMVPVTNSPQTVSVVYPGDGSTQDVIVAFSADTNCAFTALAALPLPVCTTPTNPAPVCAITNVVAVGPLPCDAAGMTGYDITVFYANGPTNGMLDVNGIMVPVTNSPQTVSVVYPGDGSTQDVIVAFSADTGCIFVATNALPLPVCNPCSVVSIAPGMVSSCDFSNGTYFAEIIVVHTNAPTNGTLDVNGQAFAVTSSPQVVTVTNLVADGLPVTVTALFSAEPACALSISNVFLAPLCVNTSGFGLVKSGTMGTCPDPLTGFHTISYSVTVLNGGTNAVTNLFLRDAVGAFIGAEFVSAAVTGYMGPSNLVANTNFTGLAPNNLLLGAGTLGTNESATVTFDVLVGPATPCVGSYLNQATFSLNGTNLLAASQVVTNMIPTNVAPTLTCPSGPIQFTLTTNAPTVTITAADIGPLSAMDDCGIVSTSVVSQTFGCFDVGMHSITATVFDACGDSASCVVPIEIICNLNVTQLMPVLGIDLAVADPGCFCGTNTPGAFLISITNAGPVAITNVVVSDPLYPACDTNIALLAIGDSFSYLCSVVLTGTTNMVLATGQANGMTAMADVGVSYSFDITAPGFFGCPVDIVLGCSDPLPGPSTNIVVIEDCSDNGLTVNVTSNPLMFCTGPGVEYIYSAVDACGNVSAPCTQRITRAVATAVAFTNTIGDISLVCGAALPAPMNMAATSCVGSVAVTVTTNTGAAGCSGTNGVQYVYTAADACGNSAIVTQNITYVDAASPVFSSTIPAGTQLACGQPLPMALAPTATDDCTAPTVAVTTMVLPAGCAALNGVEYVYTATDSCGNSIAVTQTFTYAAISGPVLSALPPGGTVECGGNVPPPQNLTALDGCGTIVAVSLNTGTLPPGCTGQSGVRYTYTATDVCGVSTVHNEDWTYVDTIGPTITCGPNQTITRISSSCMVSVPFIPRNAFDSCAQVNVTQSPAVGTQHNASTPLVVTLTATDACGNPTTCVATYTYICDVALSGTVWNDLNMNGITSDENLSALGLPGVDITIRDTSGAIVATAITSANGFWSVDVPPGTYSVEVDTSDIPDALPLVSTQPSTVTAVSGTIPNLDYGVSPEPTAISLETLEATVVDGGVRVSWTTAWEENNLGFRVWRGTVDGPTEVAGEFVLADGQASSYEITDDQIATTYWLESVDSNLGSEFDGSAETTIPAAPVGQPTATLQATDGSASFTAAADVASYLIIGFASEPTARDTASGLVLGGEVIEVDGSYGIYLSVASGTEVTISE